MVIIFWFLLTALTTFPKLINCETNNTCTNVFGIIESQVNLLLFQHDQSGGFFSDIQESNYYYNSSDSSKFSILNSSSDLSTFPIGLLEK